MNELAKKTKDDMLALARELYTNQELTPEQAYEKARAFVAYRYNKDIDGVELVDITIEYRVIATHRDEAYGLRWGEQLVQSRCKAYPSIEPWRATVKDGKAGPDIADRFRREINIILSDSGKRVGDIEFKKVDDRSRWA